MYSQKYSHYIQQIFNIKEFISLMVTQSMKNNPKQIWDSSSSWLTFFLIKELR